MQLKEKEYSQFTGRPRLDKAINSLIGLIEGVAIDGVINSTEIRLLNTWLKEHCEYQDKHPFNELVPALSHAVSDGFIDEEVRQDILWLCKRLRSKEFYDEITTGLQTLHGVLGGIAADGQVTIEELKGLSRWLEDHEYLRTCYPYDEVDSVITSVLRDGKVDSEEQKMLQGFFGEFITLLDDRTITSPMVSLSGSIQGVCAIQPVITLEGSVFCFTGESSRLPRRDLAALVQSLGGITSPSVTQKLDYLVIGAEGNPCWAYACYGRKVERAIELRKQGVRLMIVHEHDFHDAVADD